MHRHIRKATLALRYASIMLGFGLTLQQAAKAQQVPSADRIEHFDKEPQNWMSFYGSYNGWSYSALDQISRKNVKELVPAWAFAAGGPPPDTNLKGGLEGTPIVVDGVLYLVGMQNNIYAMDADTGKLRWKYIYKWPPHFAGKGTRGARGLAIGDGRVYMGTQDNHLVAVDAESGKELWNISVEDNAVCECVITSAPLFIRGKIVTGVAAVSHTRAYVRAFDAATGHLIWNFDVIPSPDEPGGDSWPPGAYKTGAGGSWITGTYDPALNVTYWGTGDPGPTYEPEKRPGANLYSDSVLALDADTGKLKWYNQEFPHDPFDFDSAMQPILVDTELGGRKAKLIVHPSKDGFVYVYDREAGKLVSTFPFTYVTWTKGLDAEGKPTNIVNWLEDKDFLMCPGQSQGFGINHPAYSPHTGFYYTTDMAKCSQANIQSQRLMNPSIAPNIAAFDPLTGKKQWAFNTTYYNQSSLLVTGGDLLFAGDMQGEAFALDAKTGQKLWSFNTGGIIVSLPMTYSVKGRQYVAISVGGGSIGEQNVSVYFPGANELLPQPSATLFVFALPGKGK